MLLTFLHIIPSLFSAPDDLSVSDDMEKGKINSITIEGVKGEGDYNLSTKEWSVSSSSASYNVPISADGLTVGTGTVNLAPNTTLMMIPQTLGDGAKVTINITPTDKSAVDLTFDLKDTKWVAGNHVTYLLSTTKIIKLNMGSVTYPHWQTAEGSAFTPEKLKSSYASGDALGMYIVDKNHKVVKANVQLTTTDGKNWNFSSSQKFIGSLSYDYFLYYPYQTGGLAGAPKEGDAVSVNSGTNQISASDFFAGAITEWGKSLKTDQGDDGKFNSCDLQIGKGELAESSSTVAFPTMTHAMGLAHVKLGKRTLHNRVTTYISNNNFGTVDPYTWGSNIAYASSEVDGRKLFPLAKYDYACIVSPGISTEFNTVKGDKNAWEKALTFTPSTNKVQMLEALVADTGSGSTEYYTIQLGDIFFNDGSITHDLKDVEISEDHCPVGIVVYLAENNDGNDKWAETNTKIGEYTVGGHGLVMALKDYGTPESGDTRINHGPTTIWGYFGTNNKTGFQSNDPSAHITAKTSNRGSGYYLSGILGSNSPAVKATRDYKPSYTFSGDTYNNIDFKGNAVRHTTGWFLPSAGQFYAVINVTCGGLSNNINRLGKNEFLKTKDGSNNVTEKINEYLYKAAGAKSLSESSCNYSYFSHENRGHWVWSSSEYDSQYAVGVGLGRSGIGTVYFTSGADKKWQSYVRAFLAF